jgi:Protein of unknown function (DUF2934)
MIEPRKQPMPKIIVDPKSISGKVALTIDSIPSQDKIRNRAYELYESRGCEPGRAQQDWLRAEQEILKYKQ